MNGNKETGLPFESPVSTGERRLSGSCPPPPTRAARVGMRRVLLYYLPLFLIAIDFCVVALSPAASETVSVTFTV
jgi:hypothetical protein